MSSGTLSKALCVPLRRDSSGTRAAAGPNHCRLERARCRWSGCRPAGVPAGRRRWQLEMAVVLGPPSRTAQRPAPDLLQGPALPLIVLQPLTASVARAGHCRAAQLEHSTRAHHCAGLPLPAAPAPCQQPDPASSILHRMIKISITMIYL
jgi:hypothetical protein